jgi:hypothetical protein
MEVQVVLTGVLTVVFRVITVEVVEVVIGLPMAVVLMSDRLATMERFVLFTQVRSDNTLVQE